MKNINSFKNFKVEEGANTWATNDLTRSSSRRIDPVTRNIAIAAIAATIMVAVSPEQIKITNRSGETRNAIISEQFTGEVVNVKAMGTSKFGSQLEITMETDKQEIIEFNYIEELQDPNHEHAVLKNGDKITIKVKEGEDFYYHGWGGKDSDVELNEPSKEKTWESDRLMKFENFYLPPEDEDGDLIDEDEEELEEGEDIEDLTPEGDDN